MKNRRLAFNNEKSDFVLWATHDGAPMNFTFLPTKKESFDLMKTIIKGNATFEQTAPMNIFRIFFLLPLFLVFMLTKRTKVGMYQSEFTGHMGKKIDIKPNPLMDSQASKPISPHTATAA
jgi:hypothetical protein